LQLLEKEEEEKKVGGARLNPVRQEGRGPWRWVPHDERGRGGPDVLSAPDSTIGAAIAR
jgi:hypothetical protein